MTWYYAWVENRLIARSNYVVAVRRIIFNRLSRYNRTAKITTDLQGKNVFEIQRDNNGWIECKKKGNRYWYEISDYGEIVGSYKLNKPKKVIVEWFDRRKM